MQTRMQTPPWTPSYAAPRPSSWWAAIGWYAAGIAATVATGMVVVVVGETAPQLPVYSARVIAAGAFVGAVAWSLRLPPRHRVAWWLGIATPIVLTAFAIGVLLLAWANSDYTF